MTLLSKGKAIKGSKGYWPNFLVVSFFGYGEALEKIVVIILVKKRSNVKVWSSNHSLEFASLPINDKELLF